jgi:hypothetical protein
MFFYGVVAIIERVMIVSEMTINASLKQSGDKRARCDWASKKKVETKRLLVVHL